MALLQNTVAFQSPGRFTAGPSNEWLRHRWQNRFIHSARINGQSMPTGYGISGLGPAFAGGYGGFRARGRLVTFKAYAHRWSAGGQSSSVIDGTGKGVLSWTVRIGFQPSATEIADAVWAHPDAGSGGGGGGGGGSWPGVGQFWP